MTSPALQSPCIRNCCLDQNNICIGCGRSLDEILRWSEASHIEKQQISTQAIARKERHHTE